MRFVLYTITWVVVVQTFGNLLQGEIDQFLTGVFISGLMLWWSKSVRDRRRKRLGLDNNSSDLKSKKRRPRAAHNTNSETEVPNGQSGLAQDLAPDLRPELDATRDELEQVKLEVEKAKNELSRLWAETKAQVRGETESTKEKRDEVPQPSEEHERSIAESEPLPFDADADSASDENAGDQPQADSPSSEQASSGPPRPVWKDSQGNNLHVGAKVNFLANSRGQSVSITGILLGESDGQARIEVGSGTLLPRNDYSIPWSVVSLAS